MNNKYQGLSTTLNWVDVSEDIYNNLDEDRRRIIALPIEGKEEGDLLANNSKPEYVICAAIWFKDGNNHVHQPKNIDTGFVVCGRRHHNCYYIASVCLAEGYSEVKGTCVQGFLTSKDIFLDRKEAGRLAFEQKQIPELTDCLFSEDLY